MSFIMITTSAKTLDTSIGWEAEETTSARYSEVTSKLVKYLSKLSVKKIQQELKVSEKLATQNVQRFQQWQNVHSAKNSKPAILTYNGDIYKQFTAKDFSRNEQAYAQKYLRISSGLYGLIRPYDLIQPYRLEMRTKLKYTKDKAMNDYWRDKATESLNQDCKIFDAKFVLNLASKEYAKVIDLKKLGVPMITAEFQENKDGTIKTIPLYSKQARGMMVGFAIKNQITTIKGLEKFSTAGYSFESKTAKTILFTRKS